MKLTYGMIVALINSDYDSIGRPYIILQFSLNLKILINVLQIHFKQTKKIERCLEGRLLRVRFPFTLKN